MFNQFHGDQIYRGHRQIEKTVQAILEQVSSFPAEVVKLFVNVRFFRRIKLMNINLKEKQIISFIVYGTPKKRSGKISVVDPDLDPYREWGKWIRDGSW